MILQKKQPFKKSSKSLAFRQPPPMPFMKTSRPHPIPIIRGDATDVGPEINTGKKYTSYRKGLLINIYQMISRYGNFGDQDKFIKECLNDQDINELLNNQVVDNLDNLGGIPKLLLTIYSKFISHKYII